MSDGPLACWRGRGQWRWRLASWPPLVLAVERGLCCVAPGREIQPHHPPLPSVAVDNRLGAQQLAHHPMALAHPPDGLRTRRFGRSQPPSVPGWPEGRVIDIGLPIRNLVWAGEDLDGYEVVKANSSGDRVAALWNTPTGLVVVNHTDATGANTAPTSVGQRYPRGCRWWGFDDIVLGGPWYALLTAVRQPLEDIAPLGLM